MFTLVCFCKCDIFDMNYVASLLYFAANKVNLEKSHKSAKCVCYHQIRATKMEQVINFHGSAALPRIDSDCQAFNILNLLHYFFGEISKKQAIYILYQSKPSVLNKFQVFQFQITDFQVYQFQTFEFQMFEQNGVILGGWGGSEEISVHTLSQSEPSILDEFQIGFGSK